MRRRLLLSLVTVGLCGHSLAQTTGAASAEPPPALPRITVPQDLLQTEVAKRFPVRYPVAGLVNLDLGAPRLGLLPAQNRLRAEMPVTAAGVALARTQQGSFTVDFALRYEHSDRSLRAHQLKVYRFRFPGLQPEAVDLLNTYAPALAEQSLREVVLYQLPQKEAAMADLLGLRPGQITVTEQGLLVELVQRPPQ
ncbi:DUF1439 domain-containing protein [Hydrogenophaga pseudoflava]|uniref:DUF1439 domain-containing protein n=1 Tax=Hydrogenophaga pseudoflava TaxID=47421 RepID=UPI000A8558BE|nr:DUF1439 domain-containing protein [Hydrogenophaga pseudoflava]